MSSRFWINVPYSGKYVYIYKTYNILRIMSQFSLSNLFGYAGYVCELCLIFIMIV